MTTIAKNRQQSLFNGITGTPNTDDIYSSGVAGVDLSTALVKLFDDVRDNLLITKGTHFCCLGHLTAVPIGERSPRNPSYCCRCLEVIEAERKKDKDVDTWAGEVFIHWLP
jgi:hypothetical protein